VATFHLMDGPRHSQNVNKWSGPFIEHSKMVWEIVSRIHIWSWTFTECSESVWEVVPGDPYMVWGGNMTIIYLWHEP